MSDERARNEGPGGCVPWERYIALESQNQALQEALRRICEARDAVDSAKLDKWDETYAEFVAALDAAVQLLSPTRRQRRTPNER